MCHSQLHDESDTPVFLGLKAMVNTLLRSLKLLSDVLVLFLFFLAVMALIGVQLFVGHLRQKCVLNTDNYHHLSISDRAKNKSKYLSLELKCL